MTWHSANGHFIPRILNNLLMWFLHAQDSLSIVRYGKDNRLLDIYRLGQPATCPLYDNKYLFLTWTTNLMRDNNYRGRRRTKDHVENIWFYISMERKQFRLFLLGYLVTRILKKEANLKVCAVYELWCIDPHTRRKYVRRGRRIQHAVFYKR